jgi:hypothetical protein
MICVNRSLKRQGNSRGTAWERNGICESAFIVSNLRSFLRETTVGKTVCGPFLFTVCPG